MFACTDIVDTPTPPGPLGEDEKEITIALSIPETSLASSLRSISDAAEEAIPVINVLAFRRNAGNELVYDYSPSLRGAPASKGNHMYTVTIVARVKDYEQQFVMITNVDTATYTALRYSELWNDGQGNPRTKNDILTKLTFSLDNIKKGAEGGWNTNSETDYAKFPMWGESGFVRVERESSTNSISMRLLRMLAKVNVELASGVNNFKLNSVRIYNTYKSGRIVPDAANLVVENNSMHVNKVTLPAGVTFDKDQGLRYNVAVAGATSIKNTIYTFERDAYENLCVVIGGVYGTDTSPTYYRVDFRGSDKQLMPLLRNYVYTFKINNVSGSGYPDEGTAYESRAVNVDVEVLSWSDDNLDIVFDGTNYLSLTKKNYDFSRKTYGVNDIINRLNLDTDVSDWSLDSIIDATTRRPLNYPNDWVKVYFNEDNNHNRIMPDPNRKYTTTPANLQFYLDTLTGDVQRAAYILFTAGRLHYYLVVAQYPVDPPSIVFHDPNSLPNTTIEDIIKNMDLSAINSMPKIPEENLRLKLPYGVSTTRFLGVSWFPANADVEIAELPSYTTAEYLAYSATPRFRDIQEGKGYFYWNPATGVEIPANIGLTIYRVVSNENSRPAVRKSSIIRFSVSNGYEEVRRDFEFYDDGN
jgi:hypothetical protein